MGSWGVRIESLPCLRPRVALGHPLCEASLGLFDCRQLWVEIVDGGMKGLEPGKVHSLKGAGVPLPNFMKSVTVQTPNQRPMLAANNGNQNTI